jgi:hypothetical protein
VTYPVIPIFHPTYLLRKGDQALARREKKGETYETVLDLEWAFELLEAEYQSTYGTNYPYKDDNHER